MVHYSSIEYITLLVYSVLMPLSGTFTSADPILVSTLPGNYLPIYRYIENIYKIVILYGNIFSFGYWGSAIFWEINHEFSNTYFL